MTSIEAVKGPLVTRIWRCGVAGSLRLTANRSSFHRLKTMESSSEVRVFGGAPAGREYNGSFCIDHKSISFRMKSPEQY